MLRVELFQGDVVRLLVTSLFAIVLVSSHVSAADTEWDGSSSTNWFESANWTDGVPDDGDDVVIKSGCPNYPVLNANGAECKDLEIEDGATITIGSYVLIIRDDLTPKDDDVLISNGSGELHFTGGGTGDITENLVFAGDFRVDKTGGGGKVKFKKSITVNDIHLDDGKVDADDGQSTAQTVTGNITIASGTTFDRNRATLTIGGNVTINGTYDDRDNTGQTIVGGNWTDSGNFRTGNNAVLFNGGGTSLVTVPDSNDFEDLTISNSTTVRVTSDIDIDNGTVTVPTGCTFDVDGDLDMNSGDLTVTGTGTVRIGDSVTTLGTFTPASGTVYYDSTSAAQTVYATTYNNLEIAKSSYTATASGTFTVNGTTTVTSGTLDVASSGVLTATGAMTVAGTLTLTNGGDLLLGTGATISSGGAFRTSGVTQPTVNRSGSADYTFTVASGGTIGVDGLNFTNCESTGLTLNAGSTIEVLRDVDFTSIDPDGDGSNDTFVRVLETASANYQFIDMSFDSSTTYNVSTASSSGVNVRMVLPSGARGTEAYESEGTANSIDWPLFTRSWVGGSSGAQTSWGTAANWSPSGVPSNTDDCIIPNTSNDPILDVNGTAALVYVDDSAQLTLNNASYQLDLEDELIVSGSGTFSMTNGTLVFSGTSSQSINNTGGTAITVYNLTVNSTGTLVPSVNVNVSGALTVSAGTLDLESLTMTTTGATDVNATLKISSGTYDANGSFDASGGAVTFTGAGRLQLGSSVTSLGTFTANASTVEYDDTSAARTMVNATYNDVEIDTTSRTVSAGTSVPMQDLTVTSGTFDVGSNTVTAAGAVDNNATMTISTGTLDVGGAFDATGGSVTFSGAGRLQLGGAVTSLGTFTESTSTIEFDDTVSDQTVPPDTYYKLEIDKSNATATVAGALTISNTLTMTAGNLDVNGTFNATGASVTFAGSGRISLGGALTSLGTLTPGSGTIEFDNTSAGVTIPATTYYDLEVDTTSQIALTGGDVTVTDDVVVTSGELEVDDGDTLRVDDDVSIAGILDIEPSSKITLADASTLSVTSGGEFESVGNTSSVTTVTATDTGTPGRYTFEVLAGGIIDARYVNFRYMDSSGIQITDNASVTAITQLSDAIFDNGPSSGTLLHITSNDNAVSLADLNFFDTNGSTYNVATTNATATITLSTYGGDFGGPSNENDNGSGTVTPGYIIWGTFTPVRLLSFDATATANGVDLEWETGAEWNCAGFIVERLDSRRRGGPPRITRIGAGPIRARGASGLGATYSITDPASSTSSIYRLVEIDARGRRATVGKTGVKTKSIRRRRSFGVAPSRGASRAAATIPGRATGRPRPGRATRGARSRLQPRVVLETQGTGIVRVMYEDLVASGFEVSQNPRNFGMQRGGETWPIWIDGENDGVFDPGDAIYWVAPGYDEADSRTDAFVLSASSRRPLRMRDSVPTASYSVTSVPHVSAFEENALFVAAHRDAERDEPWFWDYLIGGESLTVPVTVEAPVSSETARLHVFMQGFTDNPGSLIDHETHVWLNGAFIGTLTASESGPYHETFEVPTWVLVPGVNDIVFEHAALTALDIAYLDRIELSYTRETRAAEDLIELTLGGPTALHIDGFSGVDVVAITRDEEGRTTWHDTSLMVSSSNGYGIDLEVDHPAVVHAAAISRLLSPTRIRPFHRRPRVTAAPIDLLVFHPKAFTRALKPLLTLRKSQGYRVQAVTLESAYDTWGDGRVSCKAIAASVRACHTRHPDHDLAVLLVGDATYDPKGYAGPQPRQILPTEFVTTSTITVPSDDGYVDFDLDTVPDAAIGRLSVATENELTEVVRKIIGRSYARRGHVALLSDREGEFEWFSSELEREWSLAGPVSTLGGVASTPSEIREDLIAEWGHLPSVVSYSGHGSRITWGLDMILTREDIADLAANGPLPIVVTFNCLSGYFTHPLSPSIGEQFVLEPDAGACAYWGPTALTTTLTQIMLGERFVEELTVPGATLGSAILAAKRALPEAAVETRRTWVLLGDPLTRP